MLHTHCQAWYLGKYVATKFEMAHIYYGVKEYYPIWIAAQCMHEGTFILTSIIIKDH